MAGLGVDDAGLAVDELTGDVLEPLEASIGALTHLHQVPTAVRGADPSTDLPSSDERDDDRPSGGDQGRGDRVAHRFHQRSMPMVLGPTYGSVFGHTPCPVAFWILITFSLNARIAACEPGP